MIKKLLFRQIEELSVFFDPLQQELYNDLKAQNPNVNLLKEFLNCVSLQLPFAQFECFMAGECFIRHRLYPKFVAKLTHDWRVNEHPVKELEFENNQPSPMLTQEQQNYLTECMNAFVNQIKKNRNEYVEFFN